ncbi:glycosyltransferase family protein [bacterium]|nr:glycosyltransferase family protein [bacterium]
MLQILCIIQARMGSTRFPGKVLKEAGGMPLLEYEIRRVRLAKSAPKIVVATSTNPENDAIEDLCRRIGVDCFRGSEDDVLERYYECARAYPEYSAIMRLTGDCPLIDPAMIDRFTRYFEENEFDYVGPSAGPGKETFPEGVAEIEIFTRGSLHRAARDAKRPPEREHVTLYFVHNPNLFKIGHVELSDNSLAAYRLVVDNPEDFSVVKFLIEKSDIMDGYMKHIALLRAHPEYIQKVAHIERNEGLQKSYEKERKEKL